MSPEGEHPYGRDSMVTGMATDTGSWKLNLSHKAETAHWEWQEAVKSQSQPPGTDLLHQTVPPAEHYQVFKCPRHHMETTTGASLHLTGQNNEDGPLWLTTIRTMNLKSASKEKV